MEFIRKTYHVRTHIMAMISFLIKPNMKLKEIYVSIDYYRIYGFLEINLDLSQFCSMKKVLWVRAKTELFSCQHKTDSFEDTRGEGR